MGYTNIKGDYVPSYIDLYGEGPYTDCGSVLTPEQLAECEKMSVKDCVAYKEKIMENFDPVEYMRNKDKK
jgi:hypothetical protein